MPEAVVDDAAEGLHAEAFELGGGLVDVVDFDGDVVEAWALLVEELLDEGVWAGGGDDFELDSGAADLGHAAIEVGVGAGFPRVEELETEQALELFSLRLPTRRGHADVVDALNGKQRGLRARM